MKDGKIEVGDILKMDDGARARVDKAETGSVILTLLDKSGNPVPKDAKDLEWEAIADATAKERT